MVSGFQLPSLTKLSCKSFILWFNFSTSPCNRSTKPWSSLFLFLSESKLALRLVVCAISFCWDCSSSEMRSFLAIKFLEAVMRFSLILLHFVSVAIFDWESSSLTDDISFNWACSSCTVLCNSSTSLLWLVFTATSPTWCLRLSTQQMLSYLQRLSLWSELE